MFNHCNTVLWAVRAEITAHFAAFVKNVKVLLCCQLPNPKGYCVIFACNAFRGVFWGWCWQLRGGGAAAASAMLLKSSVPGTILAPNPALAAHFNV
jgi:hypothetical protein